MVPRGCPDAQGELVVPWTPADATAHPMPRALIATSQWAAPAPAPVSSQKRYVATDDILGGGLNNMLLHLSQLLEQACSSNATLILPFFHADPLAKSHRKQCKVVTPTSAPASGHRQCRALAFSKVFDLAYFRSRVPCNVVEKVPSGAGLVAVTLLKLDPINAAFWAREHGRPMVATVYAAIRPSGAVQALLDRLLALAEVKAGTHWAAVHMPIELDWYWETRMCHPEDSVGVRRCYSPAEVAEITRGARRGTTGTLLMYASDKVSFRGPHVCLTAFGNATYKLALPAELPYTLRNAAEQFLAASAPAGFFGCSFSTFSRGTALLRGKDQPSYSYDCSPVIPELAPHATNGALNSAGFRLLRMADRSRCPTTGTRLRRRNPSRRSTQAPPPLPHVPVLQAPGGGDHEWEWLPAVEDVPFRPAFVPGQRGGWREACYSAGGAGPARACGVDEALASIGATRDGRPNTVPPRRLGRLARGA